MIDNSMYQTITDELGLGKLIDSTVIQTLWSGYGQLIRLRFELKPVIVKHVLLPQKVAHPKGWNTNLSHQRKLYSYEVEVNWYEHFSQHLNSKCRVPKGLKTFKTDTQWLIVMEDLAQSGFDSIVTQSNEKHLKSGLSWLAYFHAKYMKTSTDILWSTGTYWHLDTRPDEFEVLEEGDLKKYAKEFDSLLSDLTYQTIVHGDAKLANFCFNHDGTACAAVDFQYVGHGCGMKDVIYFMSSAITPNDCKDKQEWILDTYFEALHKACAYYNNGCDANLIEKAWRPLFAVAWADFYRFLKGWSPTHYKINGYTEAVTKEAIVYLKGHSHV